MFNPTLVVIEAFIRELRTMYERTYGMLEPGYPGTISFVAQLALENIATSDAAYHDVTHTIMATDASMTPYHVARSKLFVRERFGKALVHLDTAEIEVNIEHTRFPVPEEEEHEPTDDFPGLVRAADLIGQVADINYLRKTAALFNEFRETGMSKKLNYNSAADLRANYPQFFWQRVQPYTVDALRYLRVTQEGQQWVANLYANVFSMEHKGQTI